MKLFVEMDEQEYEKYKKLLKENNELHSEMAQKIEQVINSMDISQFLRNKGFVVKDSRAFCDEVTKEKILSVISVKDNYKVTVEAKYKYNDRL